MVVGQTEQAAQARSHLSQSEAHMIQAVPALPDNVIEFVCHEHSLGTTTKRSSSLPWKRP
jgi:hypothetical protein